MSDKKNNEKLVFGLPPRADLMPPEFKAESQLRRQRRGLVGLAVVSVIVVILAYGYATFGAAASDQRHQAALAQTQSLLDQQKTFADVGAIQGRINALKAAQTVGATTEINWETYLELVRSSLPSDTIMGNVAASSVLPGKSAALPGSPLEGISIAEIQVNVISKTLPDVSAWIDNLQLLPGFVDVTSGEISRQDVGGYSVVLTMHVNDVALSHRFDPPATDQTSEDSP